MDIQEKIQRIIKKMNLSPVRIEEIFPLVEEKDENVEKMVNSNLDIEALIGAKMPIAIMAVKKFIKSNPTPQEFKKLLGSNLFKEESEIKNQFLVAWDKSVIKKIDEIKTFADAEEMMDVVVPGRKSERLVLQKMLKVY